MRFFNYEFGNFGICEGVADAMGEERLKRGKGDLVEQNEGMKCHPHEKETDGIK